MTEPARERIGRFELVETLGRGPSCVVHLARSRGRDGQPRIYALKHPHERLLDDRAFVMRFLDAADRAATLEHPSIARIVEVGEEGRLPFVAMEYVHGEQLGPLLRRVAAAGGEPPRDVLLRILERAAEAVEHARASSETLVHGRLKPENVFVTYDGEVRVTDFGMPPPPDDAREEAPRGRALYLAPEQARREPFDARADVFSLGAMLWECVTLRPAFKAATEAETLAQVRLGEVPAPSTLTDCPPELERITMRALAESPDDRYARAGELARELDALVRRRHRDTTPVAITAVMRDVFAQRWKGRDATVRRTLRVEDAAPAASSSAALRPSIPVGAPERKERAQQLPIAAPAPVPEPAPEPAPAAKPEPVPRTAPETATATATATEAATEAVPVPVATPARSPAPAAPADTRSRSVAIVGATLAVALGIGAWVWSRTPTVSDTVSDTVSNTVSDTVSDTVSVSVSDPEPEPDPDPDPEPEPEPDPEPDPDPEPEPEPDPDPEPEPVPASALAAPAAARRDLATLEVVCRPAAEIFVNGRSIGLTPRIADVPAGPILVGLRGTGPEHRWRTVRGDLEPRESLQIPMSDCP